MSDPSIGLSPILSNQELAAAILVAHDHTSSTEIGLLWQNHLEELLAEQKRRATLFMREVGS